MWKEYGDKDEILGLNEIEMQFTQNKYMTAFRNIFESGYEKDFGGNSIGKWYMMCVFAKANDYFYTGITESGIKIKSEADAIKLAFKSMETSVTKLNPNKRHAILAAKTKQGKMTKALKAIQFEEWLDKRGKGLSKEFEKLGNQYWARRRLLKNSISDYISQANLKKDLEHYGISLRSILK